MYTVYILQSTITGKYYIGSTSDLSRRLNEHNSNKTSSLKNKGPFILIHTEEYSDRVTAYRRELQIKSYKGGNSFKKLINKMR